jgi:uncharacterized protein YndB with AHSA1/START domain
MDTATPIVVTVEATVNAPVEKVWNNYNNPDNVTKWNFAADDWQCPWAKSDFRVGGEFSARMEAKDGSFGFDFGAKYTAIETNKKISYVMGDGRNCTVTFTPQGNATHVSVAFDAESQNPVEMQKGGWQAILNNFKKYTEQ